MMRHGDRVGVRMRGDQHGGGSDHGIVVFGEASRPSGEPRSGYGWVESLAVDSGWDALSDTLKSVRPSLRSDSASRPASALTAVSDPVFRDVRNCAYRSLSRAVSFSARPRELTNTRVVWCFSTSSSTLRSMAGHTEPPVETREVCSSPPTEVSPLRSANASMAGPTPEICVVWRFGSFTAPALRPASSETGSRMAESGSTTFRSMSGCDSGLMTRTGRVPPRKRAASAGGSTVAESPMRWTDRPARLSNRSKLSARCAPRLSPRWRALHPR